LIYCVCVACKESWFVRDAVCIVAFKDSIKVAFSVLASANKSAAFNLTNYGPDYAGTLSIICVCHLTRADRVGIVSRYEATPLDSNSITTATTQANTRL